MFGPSNALILLYDHLTPESAEEMEAQIDEVGRFYKFVKLSELAEKPKGRATVAFQNPRKSVFQHGLPFLRALNIPATLFVDPDCVGMNRLPLVEEASVYRSAYPGRFSDDIVTRAWSDPDGVEAELRRARAEVGPLPVESLDPGLFFATWGRIFDIPPPLRELGWHVGSRPKPETLAFLRRQTGENVSAAYCPGPVEREWWNAHGITSVVGGGKGEVTSHADRLSLPSWRFERVE